MTSPFKPYRITASERWVLSTLGDGLPSFLTWTTSNTNRLLTFQWLPLVYHETTIEEEGQANIGGVDEEGQETEPEVIGRGEELTGLAAITEVVNLYTTLEQRDPPPSTLHQYNGGPPKYDENGNLLLVRRKVDNSTITPQEVVLAIFKGGGHTQMICNLLQCSTRTYYFYLQHFTACREALTLSRERRVDFAEGKLMERIADGDTGAIKFYLTTQGKHRGYVTKVELEIVVQREIDRMLNFLEGSLVPWLYDEILQALMKYDTGLGVEFPEPGLNPGEYSELMTNPQVQQLIAEYTESDSDTDPLFQDDNFEDGLHRQPARERDW